MCEYCKAPGKEIKLHRQETDSNITECFIHIASDGAALFLRQQFVVGFTDDYKQEIKQLNDYVYADIEYCPMCGRKLNHD